MEACKVEKRKIESEAWCYNIYEWSLLASGTEMEGHQNSFTWHAIGILGFGIHIVEWVHFNRMNEFGTLPEEIKLGVLLAIDYVILGSQLLKISFMSI